MSKCISSKIFSIIILLLSNIILAQDHAFVTLKEVKTGKRLDLYAVNTGTISYDVFLQVETKDYRRSSLRPIIKTIPAKSKTKLTTIIQLDNTAGVYDATLIVNEVSAAISIDKDKQNFENKVNTEFSKKQLIIFTETNCTLCEDTKKLLEKNHLQYIEYNITNNMPNYSLLTKALTDKKITAKPNLPILVLDDAIYTDLKNSNDIIKLLQKHF